MAAVASAAAPTVEPDGKEYIPPMVRPTAGLSTSSLATRARQGPRRHAQARGRSRGSEMTAATTAPTTITTGERRTVTDVNQVPLASVTRKVNQPSNTTGRGRQAK